MAIPDIINGSLETISSFAVLNNCRVLFKHKQVRGVSILTNLFYVTWGFFNLFYYPSLHQPYSFLGGILVITMNSTYTSMLVWYVLKEKDEYELKW